MVGSMIWPIATGLFWKKANARGAVLGMLLGTAAGLAGYFTVGWYAASLISAAVSMIVVLTCTHLYPASFAWATLNETNAKITAKPQPVNQD